MTVEEMARLEPAEATAVGAFEGGELVAVGLIGPEGEPGQWRVRGMATALASRRRGAGSAVLAALLERARLGGAREVWASVRTPAVALYERAGFQVASEVYELEQIGPHVVMRLPLDEPAPAAG